MVLLGADPSADEEVAKRGREGDGEQGREEHHEGLRIGERPEEPARLPVQCEDRQERDGDDEQREEDGRGDLSRGLGEQLPAVGVRGRVLELLVSRFDHHDFRVDGRADSDGDASQAHDGRRDVEQVHRDEGQRDGHGQRQNGQEGAAHVEEEQQDDQADDDGLLDERPLERAD